MVRVCIWIQVCIYSAKTKTKTKNSPQTAEHPLPARLPGAVLGTRVEGKPRPRGAPPEGPEGPEGVAVQSPS